MNSMTGYGRGSQVDDTLEITVEASTVNRKTLEVSISSPREWSVFERDITDLVRGAIQRGKLSLHIQVKRCSERGGLVWDETAIGEALSSLKELALSQGVPFEPDTRLLLQMVNTMGKADGLPVGDETLALLKTAVSDALNALVAMRAAEGQALAEDLASRIQQLRDYLEAVQAQAGDTVARYRGLLMERLEQAGLSLDVQDERVLKEISLFADRCDISEEVTRLVSHMHQFEETCQSEGMIGRKLDFLCQELHREINTIGSKANNVEVTKIVIDMKNELERIREQVQNVE